MNCDICQKELSSERVEVTFRWILPGKPPAIVWERHLWICPSCYIRYEASEKAGRPL